MARASAQTCKVFFLGASQDNPEAAITNLCVRFPDLQIAGVHHGYFTESDVPAMVAEINQADPDILFLRLPQQECFVADYFNQLNVPSCLTVGG